MRLRNVFFVALFLLLSCSMCFADGTLYQYSTIDSLLLGNYDGELTVAGLLEHGDVGLGTFNGLDGEMVLVDGIVYRINKRGEAETVTSASRTPFAVAARFKTDSILKIDNVTSLEDLNRKIDSALGSENIFYVVRIDGEFGSVRARSVPPQKKPYPPLVDVVKEQGVFKFSKIKGSLIGVRCPAYVAGIGVDGFHWHFITEDRKSGGHVLDCSFANLPAKVGAYTNFLLQLPETSDFLGADLQKDKKNELKKVEKNPGSS